MIEDKNKLKQRGDTKMKILLYSLFGVAILFVCIFFLSPDTKAPETTKTPKATSHVPEKEISPAASPTHDKEKAYNTTPIKPLSRESLQEAESKSFETHEMATGSSDFSQKMIPGFPEKGENVLSAPEDPFGMGNAPDFPPLSESGMEEEMPFGDLPMEELGGGWVGKDNDKPNPFE